MKRLMTGMILLAGMTSAMAETYVEGKDYQRLGAHQKATQKVSVTEFFSYGCPWCYRLEPSMVKWKDEHGNEVKFHRVPVIFHKEWLTYAKTYYVLMALGKEPQLTQTVFDAIQKDKKSLETPDKMIDFLSQKSIDKETLKSAFYYSTIIDVNVKKGNQAMGHYAIEAVPAVIINKEFKVDIQMAGSMDRMFLIMNALVEKSKG